jgi:hypothetical protein
VQGYSLRQAFYLHCQRPLTVLKHSASLSSSLRSRISRFKLCCMQLQQCLSLSLALSQRLHPHSSHDFAIHPPYALLTPNCKVQDVQPASYPVKNSPQYGLVRAPRNRYGKGASESDSCVH